MPWRAASEGGPESTFSPLMAIEPWSGFSVPVVVDSRVDFPAPFSPTRPRMPKRLSVKLTDESATVPGYRFVTSCSSSAGGAIRAPVIRDVATSGDMKRSGLVVVGIKLRDLGELFRPVGLAVRRVQPAPLGRARPMRHRVDRHD